MSPSAAAALVTAGTIGVQDVGHLRVRASPQQAVDDIATTERLLAAGYTPSRASRDASPRLDQASDAELAAQPPQLQKRLHLDLTDSFPRHSQARSDLLQRMLALRAQPEAQVKQVRLNQRSFRLAHLGGVDSEACWAKN